ncbi:MAG: 16S rRNA (cytidine(1402)-2'-O)-methyltransferase [Saprospiraceae bacterium]|nr:16S rRNA (cytidine(1402)-2'-O)-methyltransferase [Saprospiraceae bacterium]
MLFIVPTPVGNLEDMTFRAINTLKEVDLIYAEDTRTSGKLLKHYDIATPLRSYHSFNEHKIVDQIIKELSGGLKIALISDAGTPGISDPGFLLTRACHESNIKVSCLPGPTAFVPALVSSGLPCDKFYFEGFLPHKKGRQTRWKFLSHLEDTIVIYESPYRLIKSLEEAKEFLGPDRMACVSREISKIYEEHKKDTVENLLEYFNGSGTVKGEMVICFHGK